jgi:hypothetical protein
LLAVLNSWLEFVSKYSLYIPKWPLLLISVIVLFYGRSPELTLSKTSGVGRKNVGSKEFSSKDVGSIDVGSQENYNRRSRVLLAVFLI